jgi:plasmid stabilization system protein ParE
MEMTRCVEVVLTERAFADIENIRDYLRRHSLSDADKVRMAMPMTIEHVAAHPHLGRERPELGVRSIGVPRYSYTIDYRFHRGRVEIIHVRDDRRRPLTRDEV